MSGFELKGCLTFLPTFDVEDVSRMFALFVCAIPSRAILMGSLTSTLSAGCQFGVDGTGQLCMIEDLKLKFIKKTAFHITRYTFSKTAGERLN